MALCRYFRVRRDHSTRSGNLTCHLSPQKLFPLILVMEKSWNLFIILTVEAASFFRLLFRNSAQVRLGRTSMTLSPLDSWSTPLFSRWTTDLSARPMIEATTEQVVCYGHDEVNNFSCSSEKRIVSLTTHSRACTGAATAGGCSYGLPDLELRAS